MSGDVKSVWQADFSARAAAYWNEDVTRKQLGDKQLPLMPASAGPLLRALGLLRGDASMPPESMRKFMQINHMLVLLEDPLRDLIAMAPTVRLLDAGCGSSYLTYLLAWSFVHWFQHPAEIIGVDRNPAVIDKCRERMTMVDLEGVLRFETAGIADIEVGALWQRAFGREVHALHGLLSLHACDTATDDALALALRSEVELIAVAPCCQAELARKWSELPLAGVHGAFAPLWSAPHLRRHAGATLTDAMRMLLVRGAGYDVTPMEFVPSEHTPKNTLLRARRRSGPNTAALAEYVALKKATGGVGIALEALLPASLHDELLRL
jgi:SAM-dependent methyltransferase